MGLFNIFKKDNDNKTLREYLELYPGWYLYKEALKSLTLAGFLDNGEMSFAPIGIKTIRPRIEYLTWSGDYKRFVKDGISIPKKFMNDDINLIELLEIATEKGHFEAPFVLFLIYEYGLDKIDSLKQLSFSEMEANRNHEKAAAYRELAKSRDSSYEKAFAFIESVKVKEELPIEQCENNIVRMIFSKGLEEILKDYEKKEFEKIGIFVLCGLSQYGSAYASGFMATLLGNILMHKNEKQELFPYMENFFEYSDKDINDSFSAIANKLLDKASNGDDKAAFAIEFWKIDLTK